LPEGNEGMGEKDLRERLLRMLPALIHLLVTKLVVPFFAASQLFTVTPQFAWLYWGWVEVL
jgi:hypothetical protein